MIKNEFVLLWSIQIKSPLNTVKTKTQRQRLIVLEITEDTNNWESFPFEMNLGIFTLNPEFSLTGVDCLDPSLRKNAYIMFTFLY